MKNVVSSLGKIAVVCTLGLTINSQLQAVQTAQPNVVIMMTDNLGWGELGSYGGGELRGAPTPRLDQLAEEGMRFQNFNVEAQCTPSRSAFMTGRFPIRSGTTKVVWGMPYGLTNWEVTMAEKFKEAGYSTGMYGKWHLGDMHGRFPTDQGFDEWYGVANTTDESEYSSQFQFDPKVGINASVLQAKGNDIIWSDDGGNSISGDIYQSYGEEPKRAKKYDLKQRRVMDSELTKKAIKFIKKNAKKDKPFFAFIPFTQPHLPTLPHPDFKGITGNGNYADVVAEIDYRSGQILDTLKDLKIDNNTIVIFMSDNGPEYFYPYQGTSGPWKGNYFTAWEGSLRVPFIIRWPGNIPAGTTNNEIVHIVDIMPTLGKIAGYEMPDDRIIDGIEQTDLFLGKSKVSKREGFPVYVGDRLFAYKWKNWKMHLMEVENMNSEVKELNVPRVYNLITDPKEEYNMASNATWVLPVIFKRIVEFNKTLIEEEPVPFGTPEPYVPNPKK